MIPLSTNSELFPLATLELLSLVSDGVSFCTEGDLPCVYILNSFEPGSESLCYCSSSWYPQDEHIIEPRFIFKLFLFII